MHSLQVSGYVSQLEIRSVTAFINFGYIVETSRLAGVTLASCATPGGYSARGMTTQCDNGTHMQSLVPRLDALLACAAER